MLGWLVALGCGSEGAPVPAPPLVPAEAPALRGPPVPPPEITRLPSEPERDGSEMPAGFEPMALPSSDTCAEERRIWVGVDTVTADFGQESTAPPDGPTGGVEAEVARLIGPEPHLARRHGDPVEGILRHIAYGGVTLFFDRRVDRERFFGALRAATAAAGVRAGGVDAEGNLRCAPIAPGVPIPLSVWARLEPDGAVVLVRDGLPEERLVGDTPPTEEDERLTDFVRLEAADDTTPVAYLQAAARVAWSGRYIVYLPIVERL